MKCQDIIDILQKQSPEACACDWDNVGLLVGNPEREIHAVYLALDATDAVIAEAVQAGAELLVTHHPMIFKGMKRVVAGDFIGRRVIALIQQDMCYYAMHTNFDVKGMADLAAERLGITGCQVLEVTGQDAGTPMGIGRVGLLPGKLTVADCAGRVREAFGISQVRVFGNAEQAVERAAICPGSGKSVIEKAVQAGAQVLITGDIGHHDGIDGAAQGLSIIDAGHYGMEKLFIPYMKQYLEAELKDVTVMGQPEQEPYIIV